MIFRQAKVCSVCFADRTLDKDGLLHDVTGDSRHAQVRPCAHGAQAGQQDDSRQKVMAGSVEFRETRRLFLYICVITGAERFDLPGKLPAEEIHVVIIGFFYKQRIRLCTHEIIGRQRRRAGKILCLGRVKNIERLPGDERDEDRFFMRVVRIAGRRRKQAPKQRRDFRITLPGDFKGCRRVPGKDLPPGLPNIFFRSVDDFYRMVVRLFRPRPPCDQTVMHDHDCPEPFSPVQFSGNGTAQSQTGIRIRNDPDIVPQCGGDGFFTPGPIGQRQDRRRMGVHNACLVEESMHQRLDRGQRIAGLEHVHAELTGHDFIGQGRNGSQFIEIGMVQADKA